ncbi:MAG: AI-2E family transporter [Clostridia bacterium]|nr:AI-2E family transporter [Clostridia bacterium]
MQKFQWTNKKYTAIAIYVFLTAAALIALCLLLLNLGVIGSVLSAAVSALSSILYGIIIAFLCNPLYKRFLRLLAFVEKSKDRYKLRKGLAVVCTILTVLLVITAFIALLVPQILSSFNDLQSNFSSYIGSLQRWFETTIANFSESEFGDLLESIGFSPANLVNIISNTLSGSESLFETIVNYVLSYGGSALVQVKNIVLGIFVAIYMLLAKEKLIAQIKKILSAFMHKRHYLSFIEFCRFSNQTFSGYIIGMFTDSCLVGIVCFFIFMIFGIPYYPLISLIIGITNVIPVFGPFLGAIPSAFIVFVADPPKVIWFVLLILLIQQVDGNLIAPRILGNSTGLDPIWVIVAITFMGGFFGLPGMIIGVPTFAILYTVIKKFVEAKLAKKALPTETDYYFKKDIFDIETNQLSFEKEMLSPESNTGSGEESKNIFLLVKDKIVSLIASLKNIVKRKK